MSDPIDSRLTRAKADEVALLAHKARVLEELEETDRRLQLVRGAIQVLSEAPIAND